MGTVNTGGEGQGTYWKTLNGKFARKVKHDHPGAIERVNKNNETVFETYAESMDDFFLKEIRWMESKIKAGDLMMIVILDDDPVNPTDNQQNIAFSWPGNIAEDFLMRLPSADLTKPLSLKPYTIEEDDKKKTFMLIWQDKKSLPRFFGKATEGKVELPAWIKGEWMGKALYDRTDYYKGLLTKAVEVMNRRNQMYNIAAPASTPWQNNAPASAAPSQTNTSAQNQQNAQAAPPVQEPWNNGDPLDDGDDLPF